MKRIEVKLSLPVVAPLLDLIKASADVLAAHLAAPLTLGDVDSEMREEWREALLAQQQAELHALLALFNSDFFADSTVAFDEDNAEVIIRACAAVRLRLRMHDLSGLDDEDLESGSVEIERLPELQRTPFMCYLFLATLQELIIQHLDDAILAGRRDPDEDEDADSTERDPDERA
jgi:hypothetical protein